MKNLLIVLTLIFSTSVMAKNRVSANTKTVCVPTLEQCQKVFRGLLKLDRRYNDIDFKMDACKIVDDQYCMEGKLNLHYWVNPTQKVSLRLEESICHNVVRAAKHVSGEAIDCDLKCSRRPFHFRGRTEAGFWTYVLFDGDRLNGPFKLTGQCRIK